MKFFEKVHTYEYDWETATAAWWDKYPNAEQPHVRHWDTLHRSMDAASGVLTVHRLFWIEYGLPKWVHTVFRTPSMDGYGTENVVCDVKNKRLVMHGRNYTFRNLIEIEETCTYRQHRTNPHWTEFVHRAEFKVGKLGMLSGKLEESARDSAYGKSHVGINVMEQLIQRLHVSDWRQMGTEQIQKGKDLIKSVEKEAMDLYDKFSHHKAVPPSGVLPHAKSATDGQSAGKKDEPRDTK